MNNECIICGGNGRLMRDKEPNANCPICGSEIYLPPEVKDGDLMDIINYSLEKEHHEWLIKHKRMIIAFYLLVPLAIVVILYFTPGETPAKLPGFSTIIDGCITIGFPIILYIVLLCCFYFVPAVKTIWGLLLESLVLILAIAAIVYLGNWCCSKVHPKQPTEITTTIKLNNNNQ